MRREGRVADLASSIGILFSDGSRQTVHLLHRTLGQRAGARPFFHCPRCGRACELLYIDRTSLACRVCLRLAYSIENLTKISRTTEQLYRRRLGQEPNGAFDQMPDKPKGMHWRTYERKVGQIVRLEADANVMLGQRVDRLLARLNCT